MDGVDHLLNLLAIVKSEGLDVAFAEDANYRGLQSENFTFRPYPEPLRSLRQSLEYSKLCMAALKSITAHLKRKIRYLQKRSAPLVLEDGIKTMPDEILAHVFEAAHQMSEHSHFALRISHVSRRFRQVSFQTPLLWTRLSSRNPKDQIQASISRSGRLDLEVTLCHSSVNTEGELRSSVQLMALQSLRWSKLSLCAGHAGLEIMDEVGLTSLPRLRYLYRNYNARRLKWDMPLLSRFYGFCMFHLHDVGFLSQLTCVELYWEEERVDITSLAQGLYEMLNLQNLSLEFRDCSPEQISPMETPRPHSFHIELLKITLGDYIIESGLFFSLCGILQFLTATVVDFSLLTRRADLHSILDDKLPRGSTIRLHIAHPCNIPFVLSKLLKNCTILHSVQFEASSFDHDANFPPDWSHSPSLHHLRLQNCVTLNEKHVEMMARHLLTCTDFESLEIISCIQISEDFLEDLQVEFGEKLTWIL